MTDALSSWVDHGVTPPRRLPADAQAAAAYLSEALGHPVYERWTWRRLIQAFGALPDARRAKPAVCRLLLDHDVAIEAWQRGRLVLAAEGLAPSADSTVAALLKTHRRRFKLATFAIARSVVAAPLAATELSTQGSPSPALALAQDFTAWLQCTGRLANPHEDTNTLGARDDYAAVAAFLRERAHRSRHTWRAYIAELERLAQWCVERRLGPLSDLTRQDLLAYRDALRQASDRGRVVVATSQPPPPAPVATAAATALAARSQARALAVVASLYRYWHDTGYLLGNPAAGLTAGGTRAGFAAKRFVPARLLLACDEWVAAEAAGSIAAPGDTRILRRLRRAAIWTLYRSSGARLVELVWRPQLGLPRLEIDERGDWTLHVIGKRGKERSVPLPRRCTGVLRDYRAARGLSPEPALLERIALIHGDKGGSLGERGLYDEVKAVLEAVAVSVEARDAEGAALLRTVSPHWLRHAYARTLVVDHQVPLPAAQALLGHASVQTTAEYAKTDLSKLREFVERGFERDGN